eukprot:14545449-Ditylum_brightwellii.AAC.1
MAANNHHHNNTSAPSPTASAVSNDGVALSSGVGATDFTRDCTSSIHSGVSSGSAAGATDSDFNSSSNSSTSGRATISTVAACNNSAYGAGHCYYHDSELSVQILVVPDARLGIVQKVPVQHSPELKTLKADDIHGPKY